MTSWKFVLCRSTDLVDIAELTQARARQLSLSLNQPGSASFTIPLDDEYGSVIYPIEYAIKVYRRGTTGARLIWSGYVNAIDEDVTNNRMTVACVGWLERLDNRMLRSDVIYTDTDDGAIILDLLQKVNGTPSSPNYEWGIGVTSYRAADGVTVRWPEARPNTASFIKRTTTSTIPNEGIGGATAYVEARRTIRYVKYTTNVLQAINQLIQVENGCDIHVDPSSRILYVYRKRRRILANIVFGFQWGPENVAQYSRQLDGSTTMNYMHVTGGSGSTPQAAINTASQDRYGPFEELGTISDIAGRSANDVLRYYAGAEVAIRAYPREFHSITPFNFTPENSVPEPFVDYNVGDQVVFVARHGVRIRVNQQVRIFGISLSIDEEGNERLGQLQIYPQ